MTILEMDDVMPFGKHKGVPIELLLKGKAKDLEGIEPEIQYLQWFDLTVKTHVFSDEIRHELLQAIKKQQEETASIFAHQKKSRRYSNMDDDFLEAGMSLWDMGYEGDGAF